ncbi:hypothetical protein SS50377_22951 [Spironucleus salmonicida]|uniref:Uncharacterized protein n=1 Tax=Spironucleus salmonicida TaxID=348837 RepID=A0A9P8LWN4_9EUKA|nr:hypothetical protein SS50377_22951 [Spironucleus salmonicida]
MSRTFSISDLPHTMKNYTDELDFIRQNSVKIQEQKIADTKNAALQKRITPLYPKIPTRADTPPSVQNEQIEAQLRQAAGTFASHLESLKGKVNVLQQISASENIRQHRDQISIVLAQTQKVLQKSPVGELRDIVRPPLTHSSSAFFRGALADFEQGRAVPVVFPTDIYSTGAVFRAAVSSPFLQLGSASFEGPALYRRIVDFVRRQRYPQFALNVAWAALSYYVRAFPGQVLQGGADRNPLLATFYVLRRERLPACALVECSFLNPRGRLHDCAVGVAAVPYEGERALLPPVLRVDRLRRADRRVQLEDAAVLECFFGLLRLVVEYCRVRV